MIKKNSKDEKPPPLNENRKKRAAKTGSLLVNEPEDQLGA